MRKIKFLSVSALDMFENQPNKFYCTRLAENKLERDPQSLAAAAGTEFDILTKQYLINKGFLGKYKDVGTAIRSVRERFIKFPWYQIQNEEKSLEELFNNSLELQNRVPEIFDIGEKLFLAYIRSRLHKQSAYYDIENRGIYELNVKLSGVTYKVPIYTILDSVLQYNHNILSEYNNVLYPMDLKVSGFTSGASPKPGYCESYNELGNTLGAHKNLTLVNDGYEDFSLIDEKWATQGCTYGWSIGRRLFEPFPFEIHALYLSRPKVDGSRSIKVCGYRGIITSDFQKMVALRFVTAWNTINSNSSPVIQDYPWSGEDLIAEMLSRTESWY